ncbi:MAG TPA: hypothetical protein VGF06_16530 [Terriglobales bacterium]|jgi:dienelactone hydrolase
MTNRLKCLCVLLLLCAPRFSAAGRGLFDYDDSRPLNVEEAGAEPADGLVVHDIRFNDVADGPMRAYLVVPEGKGPFAAILYVHWLGDPETSNRTQFLEEAKQMARKGVVGLLVEMPWSNQYWYRSRKIENDYDFSVRQVQNLRRALDLLSRRPDVDRKRIALVAHDFGASFGAILIGVDSRLRCAVLMAGTPVLSDWFLLSATLEGPERHAYIARMGPLDPVNFVGKAKSVPILMQFATEDQYVPREKAELFARAAADPKELRWYQTGHPMNAQAAADRVLWLHQHLALN